MAEKPLPTGDRTSFYAHEATLNAAALEKMKRKSVAIALARGAAFIVAAAAAYIYFDQHVAASAIAGVISVLLFFVLVRVAFTVKDQMRRLSARLQVIQNEISLAEGRANMFSAGVAFDDERSLHGRDLDLFGAGSIFHTLNRCSTPHGEEQLATLLHMPVASEKNISAAQLAIQELAPQFEERLEITAQSLMLKTEGDLRRDLDHWINLPANLRASRWVQIARFVLPALTLVSLINYIGGGTVRFLILSVLINWLVLGRFAAYIQLQHQLIGKRQNALEQQATILRLFSALPTSTSERLIKLAGIASGAVTEIRSLSRISSFFDQRLNALVSLFLNSLFLYDLHVVSALEIWKARNKLDLLVWFQTTGEIEALNSLATFCFNHPSYVFPTLQSGKPSIVAQQLGHPLIAARSQVANDLNAGMEESCLLVTGSNMSGKSTFLRTVGVNLVLAQCGLPVNAKSFAFTPMKILSAIRITDSLQTNTSYFMAELKRLELIIAALKDGRPALVLLDEVLRGTNSADKTFGSAALIRRLAGMNCLTFFATHDLSLSELEKELPGKVKNYCFESEIDAGELRFDYRLRMGVAVNKNASYLMKKMGII